MSYELRDAVTWSADVLYSRTFSDFAVLPDPSRGNIVIKRDNAFLPQVIRDQMVAAGETSFTFGRVNADFARQQNDYRRRSIQETMALDGKLGDSLRWNAFSRQPQFTEANELRNLPRAAHSTGRQSGT